MIEENALYELLNIIPQEGLCEFCVNHGTDPETCRSNSLHDCMDTIRPMLESDTETAA